MDWGGFYCLGTVILHGKQFQDVHTKIQTNCCTMCGVKIEPNLNKSVKGPTS